jgi:DNA-binding SARP family transcriptional activator
VRISLLGPLKVTVDGAPVDVGGRQARGLLALLALTPGRPVAVADLVAGVWGSAPPPSAVGTLQSHVSRLRRALEPGRPAGGPSLLARTGGGYVLHVPPDAVDAERFVALADEGRSRLLAGDAEGARGLLAEALDLWRGEALADLAGLPLAARPRTRTRLEDRRTLALADRIDADLRLGRHAEVVDEAAALVAAHPLHEDLRHSLARALAQGGRRDDALAAITDARAALADASGLDLGPALRRLEDEVRRGAEPAPAPAPPADSGLVGRAGEMALVTAALDESAGGTRVVVVEGEPGIGKTRLVEELAVAAAARGCQVLWGRAFEGGATPALWPWLGPLRALLAERRGLNGGDLAPLEALVAADHDPGAVPAVGGVARFRLVETVASLVAEAAARRPLVIVLDDLQWADPASLELLTFLSGRLGPAPVLLAATVRELEVGRNDALVEALAAVGRHPTARRLPLRGLDPAGTRALVARATGRADLPHAVAAAIHRRADGNPYFTAELARYLDAEGPLDEAAVAAADVPSGVRDVVRRRLAMLPPTTADLVEVAAVVGRDVPLALLAAASGRGLDAVLDDLEPALVQRLLAPATGAAGTVRFSHALVREMVVDDLSPIRRARLHLRVADTLAPDGDAAVGDDDAEIVAEQLWAAVPLGVGLRAADALVRASDVAVRRLALTTARNLLERAVQLRRADADDGGCCELDALGRLVSVIGALAGYAAVADSPELARAKELAPAPGTPS